MKTGVLGSTVILGSTVGAPTNTLAMDSPHTVSAQNGITNAQLPEQGPVCDRSPILSGESRFTGHNHVPRDPTRKSLETPRSLSVLHA